MEYIHPTHNVELFWDIPDPHNPGWQCRFCHLTTCGAGCRPGEGMDDDELAVQCTAAPPGWRRPPRPLPLRIVRDEIPEPEGGTIVQFRSGIVQLQNGNQFQVGAGAITFTFDLSNYAVSARQAEELVRRIDELTRLGRQAGSDLANAIQMGVLSPVSMAVPDEQDNTG